MTTKTGMIAIVGRPNVGKSTLLNALLGEKLAIVSKKPQTTRTRITGVLTQGDTQYVFLDTPGMHHPKTRLGDRMVRSVRDTILGVDAAILVVEPNSQVGDIEMGLLERCKKNELPVLLVINKTDVFSREAVGQTIAAYSKVFDFVSVIPVCAMKNQGISIVLTECRPLLHEGAWMFEEDAITDLPERQIAAEIIREKLLRLLDEEIPHGTAVVIESFTEEKGMLRIRAEIFCEKESHKGIIIGKGGATLKKIGTYAREDMETFFDTKVFLDLWVKVKENWRDSVTMLNQFGFRAEE